MGASFSSNVTQAVATVMNEIQTSSSATTDEQQSCIRSRNLDNCVIHGNYNDKFVCNMLATSQNIVDSIKNNNLNNDISQKILQEATSTVGAAGVGFADASNAASAFINSDSSIISSVFAHTNQNQNVLDTWTCKGGTFYGDVNLDMQVSANFLSDQIVKDQQTNTIVNRISQDITQKATAAVEGLTGLIIAIAILIGIVGWVLFRPLQLAMGNRIVFIFIFLLILGGLLLAAFLLKWFPFNDPIDCVTTGANIGGCDGAECVDATSRTIQLKAAPLRYVYDIIGKGDQSLGQNSGDSYSPGGYAPGLLQLVIMKDGGWQSDKFGNNQCFTDFEQKRSQDPNWKNVPNPIVKKGSVYVTNEEEWLPFIKDPINAGLGRYLLCQYLQIDRYAKIFDYEKVDGPGYIFKPNVDVSDVINGITAGGTVTGSFGYCNYNSYKFQNFMKFQGAIIAGVILLIIFLFIIFYGPSQSSSVSNSGTGTQTK